jgi:hypothetical protein
MCKERDYGKKEDVRDFVSVDPYKTEVMLEREDLCLLLELPLI